MKQRNKTILACLAALGFLAQPICGNPSNIEKDSPSRIHFYKWEQEANKIPVEIKNEKTDPLDPWQNPFFYSNWAKTTPIAPSASVPKGLSKVANIEADSLQEIGLIEENSWGTFIMLEDNTAQLFTQSHELSFLYGDVGQPFYKGVTISLLDENFEVEKSFSLDLPDTTMSVSVLGTMSKNFFNSDSKREFVIQAHSFTKLSQGPAYARDTLYVVNEDGEILYRYGQANGAFLKTANGLNHFGISRTSYTEVTDSIAYDIYNAKDNSLLFHYAKHRNVVNYMQSATFQAMDVEGETYYVGCFYEKPFVDPESDPRDPSVNPDNKFIVQIYNSSDFSLEKEIKLELYGKDENEWTMGALRNFSDIALTKTYFDTDPDFELIYTVDHHLDECDCTQSDIYLMNEDGSIEKELFIGTGGVVKLCDLQGQTDEYAVLWGTSDAITGFQMVEMPSLNSTYFSTIQDGEYLSLTFERVADPTHGRQYLFLLRQGEMYNDTACICLAYFNPQGEMTKKFRLKIGEATVDYGVILTSETLNPYLFDDDEEREIVVMGSEQEILPDGSEDYHTYVAIGEEESGNLSYRIYNHPQYGDVAGAGVSPNMARDRVGSFYITYQIINGYYANDNTTVFYQLPLRRQDLQGAGTELDPYVITTPAELDRVRQEPAAWYILGNDIDMSEWTGLDFKGFSPIAPDGFSGHFDGQGHTISGLFVNTTASYAGLFAFLNGAEVRNLNIENANIHVSGNNSSAGTIAGAAGNNSILENCHAQGNVKASGMGQAGGISGLVATGSQVSQCSFNGIVESDITLGLATGGIASTLRSASITASYSEGTVQGNEGVGGIAGTLSQQAAIQDCYSAMSVKGNDGLGGIAGTISASSVTNCHASGTISSLPTTGNRASVGGIAGTVRGIMENKGRITSSLALNDTVRTGENGDAYRIAFWTMRDHDSADVNYASSTLVTGLGQTYTIIGNEDPEYGIVGNHGLSKARENLDSSFYADTLGWKMGNSLEQPWKIAGGIPHLWFEYIVRGIQISQQEAKLYIGDTLTLQTTLLPSTAANKTVWWESSDALVASVDQNGKIIAKRKGEAIITAVSDEGSFEASCRITVLQPVETLSLDKDNVLLGIGEQQALTATLTPENADNTNIRWASSNPDIAMVSNGIILGINLGECLIVASSEDNHASDTCHVTVAIPVEGIILDQSELAMSVGQTVQLTATIRPTGATNKNIVWASSNENVASVENGLVSALTEGEAVITATSQENEEISALCEVQVQKVANELPAERNRKVYTYQKTLYFQAPQPVLCIQIVDMNGKIQTAQQFDTEEGTLNLQDMATGIYIVRILFTDGQVHTLKLQI